MRNDFVFAEPDRCITDDVLHGAFAHAVRVVLHVGLGVQSILESRDLIPVETEYVSVAHQAGNR